MGVPGAARGKQVEKMMALWSGDNGPLYPLDCMMTRPDFKNYCPRRGRKQPT